MNILRQLRCGLLILLLSGAGLASADPAEIRVSAARLPYYVEPNGGGVLLEAFRELTRDFPVRFKVEVFPPKRARLVWELRRTEGFMPVIGKVSETGVLVSEPVFYQKDHVFVRVGTAPVCSWDELEARPLRLGLTEGYVYPEAMGRILSEVSGREADWVNSDELNLRKLAAGRIDAFVGEYLSGRAMIRDLVLEDAVMASPCSLARRPVSIVLKDTRVNRELMRELNRRIRARHQLSRSPDQVLASQVLAPVVSPWQPEVATTQGTPAGQGRVAR